MRWPAAAWRDGVATARRLAIESVHLAAARAWATRDEPAHVADIDDAWLTRVLQGPCPGCRVATVEPLARHAGTTARARVRVTYADLGRGDAPPESLFVKLAPTDLRTRLFVNLMRLGSTEVRFYREIAGGLRVELPRVYYASVSGRAQGFALVLEDLSARGAGFTDASQPMSVEQARLVVAGLARVHATFWESPRLGSDLAWLKARGRNALHGVERFLCALAVPAGVAAFGDLVPDALRTAVPRIVAARDALEDAWARGPLTLVHGDAHAGNLYFLPAAVVGFLDWQVTQCGQGMRDVSYFLANSIPTTMRREHERALIDLYLRTLAECGVTAPAFDVAWHQYRLHVVYAWIGATVTGAAATLQDEPIVRAAIARTSAAVLDLEALALLASP